MTPKSISVDAYAAVRIALATVAQAVEDARSDNPAAESWLFTTGYDWMDLAGLYFDPKRVNRAIGKPATGGTVFLWGSRP